MTISKDIDTKLPALFTESAILAHERLPEFHLAKCESPIEKLFLCALWARGCWVGALELSFVPTLDGISQEARNVAHAVCSPQVQIGPYRVDFLIAQHRGNTEPTLLVAVECDGHDFHEKTRRQAARDKARDRDLVCRGIQVFRFTGSEVWANAGSCADEVLIHINSEWGDSIFRSAKRMGLEPAAGYIAFFNSKKEPDA